ncbi:cache domain-containing protein [Halarcobacter ebronensis]|uniref:histidine kinase n=1 Tax=Halarcobacter ebronensis TaxID=1462615 RepID=A0A4Q1AKS0_9BACT|nr:cache domain-containing protein [Halarcobacter ebronensis]QKF81582.1 Cache sensor-containing two-component system histidine kinase [Halarcobacter ebronensis]RXK05510.1 histidine kinase [Halarcobacter ebronensis]
MFSEKNISKLIILTPVFTVILSSFFTIYFFVQSQNSYFEEESKRVEKEYIQKQKDILVKEINSVINYINYHVKKNTKLSQEELKKELIGYIETIRYEKHGYIWIHNTDYYLVGHPFRKESIGNYDIELKDAKGGYITKRFVEETLAQPDGNFMEYYWQKPNEKEFSKKLGFLKLYKPFNWIIGAGLYIDDIEKSIAENKRALEEKIDRYIQTIVKISLGIIILIGIVSFMISNKINRVFATYKENVKKKELELQDVNKNLEIKINSALNDAKKKDRAMLHQSRLARMGAMLSMIAHQWRQPLSEISAILMELEIANKFGKLDDKLLKDSVKESNRLIQFMSHTIDDFRNFFKPDKQKVEFYVDDACSEAISLASASIKSSNIKLIKRVKCNSIILGYEREFAQVMLNLISNAKDILNQRMVKNPQIEIVIDYKNGHSIISVEDNGGGVDEKHLELIFEPYFTTKESSKGTGLGLYMSKMIIEKNMNGEISVENRKNGALFRIQIG